MKIRSRKSKASPATNAKAPNPLRLDPTRTVSLRRAFGKELDRRFEVIRVSLRSMILTDDLLSLGPTGNGLSGAMLIAEGWGFSSGEDTANVFCPTGEGGGVDASCPPHTVQVPEGKSPSTDSSIEAKALVSRLSSFMGKVAGFAEKLQTAYHKVALRLNVAGLAPDLFDTIEDCQRIFYASGKAVPHPFGGPFSVGQLATISSHVLAKAYLFARKKITGNASFSQGELVDIIMGIWEDMVEVIPEMGRIPSQKWVEEYLKGKTVSNARAGVDVIKAVVADYSKEELNGLFVWVNEEMGLAVIDRMDWYDKGRTDPATAIAEVAAKQWGHERVIKQNEGPKPAGDGWRCLVSDGVVGNSSANTRGGGFLSENHNGNAILFNDAAENLKKFQEWLATQFDTNLTGGDSEKLWQLYTEAGFKKGAGRAFDDVKVKERTLASSSRDKLDSYLGGREQFLKSSFARPVAVEKIKLLAARSFSDLKNVTSDMGTRMGRILADGLVKGASPREVARNLDKELDIGRNRAEVVARTELSRAHNDGQLHSLESLEVKKLGVMVEWLGTPDDRICPECADMEGKVYGIEDAKGVLPRHPLCRCSWTPSFSEDDSKSITKNRRMTCNKYSPRSRREIINRLNGRVDNQSSPSVLVGLYEGLGQSQQMRVVSEILVSNVFCPTGEGGGVDSSCPKGGGSLAYSALSSLVENGLQSLHHEQAVHYRESFHTVLSALSDAAVERIHANIASISFVANLDRMKEEYVEAGGKVDSGKVGAFMEKLSSGEGRLCLDGGSDTGENYDTRSPAARAGMTKGDQRSYSATDTKGIYAHELGHAIDGPNRELSSSSEWKQAWDSEINKSSAPLSRYAAEKGPHEGFAEYARLIVEDSGRAEAKFPGCWGFWRKRGLV